MVNANWRGTVGVVLAVQGRLSSKDLTLNDPSPAYAGDSGKRIRSSAAQLHGARESQKIRAVG
jgi:hypothetical protein